MYEYDNFKMRQKLQILFKVLMAALLSPFLWSGERKTRKKTKIEKEIKKQK